MTIQFAISEDDATPFYLRLADAIERAIVEGALKPGDKLPPQRDIAFDLKVTVGTIGRAYQIARERGLTTGEVGRGTYVRLAEAPEDKAPQQSFPSRSIADSIPSVRSEDVKLDSTSAPMVGQAAAVAAVFAAVLKDSSQKALDYVRGVPTTWLDAGAAWLATGGWAPEPGNVVPTLGVNAAIQGIIASATHPGDRIVFEELSYAAVARAATMIGRMPLTVAADEEGMLPEELDRCAARQHPRMIFLMPAVNNPTGRCMSLRRREEIVSVARRHNLLIVEDNIYGKITPSDIPPIASLAPERTFFVSGLSKSVAAGLRVGWAACPRGQSVRVTVAHNHLTGGRPYLNMEVAARLVLSGEAERIRQAVIAEIAARAALFDEIFAVETVGQARAVPYRWVSLPSPWTSPAFQLAARNHGIRIDGEDEYQSVRGDRSHHSVRIGISAVEERQTLATALQTLKGLIDSGSISYVSVA
ncbi:PLP-dependent aminotransferase family protein [Jiella endophytica]|uniref:PLP-dependent aminotransferase family protein n=1 Tax=Jiella endophytica TaxID=2558362 RepID=A0A4Y8RVW9_9HYPH|nr:PLP-dependent aminotransferase family protein [Jiella endophytica]TFF27604.1 PLP-dependent aminotransferase family protein [Jiella endophytica]